MKKLLIALCLLPLAVMGQEIKFDTQDYKSVGVYDRWEHSPFRTGELAGNCAVVDNPDLTNKPNHEGARLSAFTPGIQHLRCKN